VAGGAAREWRAGDVITRDAAVYHEGAIAHLATQLREQDDAWRAWFAEQGIAPITVRYEELADDSQGVVAGVLDRLGLAPAEIPEPPLRRQGDDRSSRWVERARREVPA
jgi:LPS sulfotransferase NodH